MTCPIIMSTGVAKNLKVDSGVSKAQSKQAEYPSYPCTISLVSLCLLYSWFGLYSEVVKSVE